MKLNILKNVENFQKLNIKIEDLEEGYDLTDILEVEKFDENSEEGQKELEKVFPSELIEKSDGCYVGFLKTKNSAYKAIIKCRKDYIKRLRDKIKSVVKVKDVVQEFKEAYAEHKRNKIVQRTSGRSKKRF